MIDLDEMEALAKAATFDNWIAQSTYGGDRLMDEMSGTPFSCVLPENGSWPEDTICEVWGTEHDDEANAAFIAAANPVAILALIAEVRALRETIKRQGSAARAGMDAAKRAATILYAEADKARAESSPDVLASERAMNAMLTEENEALSVEIGVWRTAAVTHRAFVDAFNASPDREGHEVDEAYNRMEEAQAATRPYEQAAIDAARK